MPKKTYTNEELNALVAEFSAEFDQLVKAEVAKSGAALAKSEELRKDDESSDGDDQKSPPPDSASADASSPAPAASATSPDPASPADASAPPADASAPPAPDASASAPADPAASAAGSDPMAALTQAYSQLSPDELAMHFQALKQVLMAGQAGAEGAGMPADPMAGSSAPAAGPAAVAPLAGEGSQPVDPASTMALKSENEELTLVKSERDAAAMKIAELEKSVAALTDSLGKVLAQPMRKSITGKDIAGVLATDPKPAPKYESMTKSEITKKLLTVANDPALKKSDRQLINNYYKGEANVEALAHLLS